MAHCAHAGLHMAVQLSLLQLMPAVLLCGVQSFGAGAIAVLHSVLDFPSGSNRREPEGRKEGSNRVFVRVGCLVPVCVCVGVCLPLLLSGIVAGWLVFEVSCFGRRWFADVVVRRVA